MSFLTINLSVIVDVSIILDKDKITTFCLSDKLAQGNTPTFDVLYFLVLPWKYWTHILNYNYNYLTNDNDKSAESTIWNISQNKNNN